MARSIQCDGCGKSAQMVDNIDFPAGWKNARVTIAEGDRTQNYVAARPLDYDLCVSCLRRLHEEADPTKWGRVAAALVQCQ